MMPQKPDISEYNEFYETYMSKVSDVNNILSFLEKQRTEVMRIMNSISEEQQQHAYEEGKWTVKELLRHIIDTERLFAYRAFTISKNTGVELSGMDQDEYMTGTNDSNNSFEDLINEFDIQRQANIIMIKNLHESTFTISGIASESPVTVRANIYIIAGHTVHHLNILKERYL